MRPIEWVTTLALVGTTAWAVTLVPGSPPNHLDDPAYWGVIGYFLMLGPLIWYRWGRGPGVAGERRLLVLFLAAMPLVYLACWLRFGGSWTALVVELAGAGLFWAVAWLAIGGPPRLLAAGIAAHGLWDLAHFERSEFVPDWYALACLAVDLGVAAYVLGRAAVWSERSGVSRPRPAAPG